MQISRGKLDRLHRTPAESTAWACSGYGTSRIRARSSNPDCLIFGSCPSGRGFASALPSDGTSRSPPLRLASPWSPPDLGRGLAPPSCQACPAHPAVWKTRSDAQEDGGAGARVSHTALDGAHTTRRPQAPQAVIIFMHKHDNASRISKTRDDRDGRRLTNTRRFAPTSVHLRRNRRSRSPESVFNFSGIRMQTDFFSTCQ